MEGTCSVQGCVREVYTRGWCEMHYRRVLRTGDPGPTGPRQRGTCEAPACEKPVDAKGLCHGHYQRVQRRGNRNVSPLRRGGTMCSVEGCDRPAKARGFVQLTTRGSLSMESLWRTSRSDRRPAKAPWTTMVTAMCRCLLSSAI